MNMVLENDWLHVTLTPDRGGTLTGVCHKPTGLQVLGDVPWDPLPTPFPGLAAATEAEWLAHYTGGWPLMFPNAGDAGTVGGLFHGFHGEASVAPWAVAEYQGGLTLSRRFFSVPVTMTRRITLQGDMVCIDETAGNDSVAEVAVMWGQHVTFGRDLLAGPVQIDCGGADLLVDTDYDPDANPLLPGGAGVWPLASGKSGPVDLSHPVAPVALLAALTRFADPLVTVRRLDAAIAATLGWDAAVFPFLWYWAELGGTTEAPWSGRARLLGLEPCSTWPARGLAKATRIGAPMVRLAPNAARQATTRLRVFCPAG